MGNSQQTSEKAEKYKTILDDVGFAGYRSSRMEKNAVSFFDGRDYSYYSCVVGVYVRNFRSVQNMLDFIDRELH